MCVCVLGRTARQVYSVTQPWPGVLGSDPPLPITKDKSQQLSKRLPNPALTYRENGNLAWRDSGVCKYTEKGEVRMNAGVFQMVSVSVRRVGGK